MDSILDYLPPHMRTQLTMERLTLVRAAAEASQDLAEAVALLRISDRKGKGAGRSASIGEIHDYDDRKAALLAKHPEQP